MTSEHRRRRAVAGPETRRRRRILASLVAGIATGAVVLLAWPSSEDRAAPVPAEASPGRAVFAELGCGSCHRFRAAGATGDLAPDLDRRVPGHTAESLRAVILDPPGGMMPEDFGERATDAELDALVTFLLAGR